MSKAYELMLAKVRKKAVLFLTDGCLIERHRQTVNDAGQPVGSWYLVASVPCRVHPVQQRGNAGETAEREANRSYYTLELLPDADIQDGDRVRYQNVAYEVMEIAAPITDAIFKSVQIARVMS